MNASLPLSKREHEVATRIARGRIDKEIAEDLEISLGTVRVYWKRFAKKVGGATRTETILRAVRSGLIEVDGAPQPADGDSVELLRELSLAAFKVAAAMNERGFGALANDLEVPAAKAATYLTRLGVSLDPTVSAPTPAAPEELS